ncbi:hypothetical protein AK51_17190, partial [Serratia nematodiphila DZ0503SBS1]
EELNVFFLGSRNSFALWYQEVTSVARFNVNLITQAAQVCYFIKQNNLHYLILSKSLMDSGRLLMTISVRQQSR